MARSDLLDCKVRVRLGVERKKGKAVLYSRLTLDKKSWAAGPKTQSIYFHPENRPVLE